MLALSQQEKVYLLKTENKFQYRQGKTLHNMNNYHKNFKTKSTTA